MIQPKIQEVYREIDIFSKTQMEDCVELSGYFKEESLITFTSEEFETFKREFGKELLEKAADNAETDCEFESHTVNKESITSVLDDYLKENKI
jgi:hypothetical protein